MNNFFAFLIKRQDKILEMVQQHAKMVLISLAISMILGIVIGYLITYNDKAAQVVLYIAGVFMTVPSLALFAFLVPVLGLNMTPVIVGLVMYTQLPIIRNVYIGLKSIDQSLIDSAKGMGMKTIEINLKVRFPLALPIIFAGIRTAAVLGIGIGAIAAYIGAGGLGVYIFQGINRGIMNMVLAASILIALMTILVDKLLQLAQKAAEKYIS